MTRSLDQSPIAFVRCEVVGPGRSCCTSKRASSCACAARIAQRRDHQREAEAGRGVFILGSPHVSAHAGNECSGDATNRHHAERDENQQRGSPLERTPQWKPPGLALHAAGERVEQSRPAAHEPRWAWVVDGVQRVARRRSPGRSGPSSAQPSQPSSVSGSQGIGARAIEGTHARPVARTSLGSPSPSMSSITHVPDPVPVQVGLIRVRRRIVRGQSGRAALRRCRTVVAGRARGTPSTSLKVVRDNRRPSFGHHVHGRRGS